MSCIVISYKTNKKEHSKKLNCWFYYINSQKSKMKIALSKKANLPKFGQAQLQKFFGRYAFFLTILGDQNTVKTAPQPLLAKTERQSTLGTFWPFWALLDIFGHCGHFWALWARNCPELPNLKKFYLKLVLGHIMSDYYSNMSEYSIKQSIFLFPLLFRPFPSNKII